MPCRRRIITEIYFQLARVRIWENSPDLLSMSFTSVKKKDNCWKVKNMLWLLERYYNGTVRKSKAFPMYCLNNITFITILSTILGPWNRRRQRWRTAKVQGQGSKVWLDRRSLCKCKYMEFLLKLEYLFRVAYRYLFLCFNSLSWFQMRCLLNIWGVMLFLRLTWVIGQGGICKS